MKLIGEVTIVKVKPGKSGTYFDLIDFASGSTFQLGSTLQANGFKPEQKVRIDGDVAFGRGEYGMYMKLTSGTITPVKAG
jgi:hypothetical protein